MKFKNKTHWYVWLILTSIFTVACSKNNGGEQPPKEEDGKTSAIIVGTRVNTPSGRVYYMGAYNDIPDKVDYKNMVELGANVTIYAYGNHPYIWNGTASTLTKYDVNDEMAISKADAVSFASTGLSGFFGPPAFLSETQAYFFVLTEGKVIEFDPSKMEITQVIDVLPLPEGANKEVNANTYYPFITNDKKILLPVDANPSNFDKFPRNAQVAVFDPQSKTVKYSNDNRMSMGYNNFAKDVASGNLYYRPSKNIVRAKDYTTLTNFPTTGGMLRMKADGSYDPDFFIDLEKVLDAHCIISVIYVYGTKAVVQYVEKGWKVPADPGEWFNCPTKLALVDLEKSTYEPFSALESYGTVYSVGVVDGKEYYANFGGKDGKYYFLQQDGPKNFSTKVEALGGSGIYIARLR